MWTIESHEDVEKRLKKYTKKWRAEIENVFANLDTMLKALNSGMRPEQLRNLGFVHPGYNHGVLSIDQRGPGKGSRMKEFRLYVFPDDNDDTLHVVTVGDKSTQSEDVRNTERFVRELRRRKEQMLPGGLDSMEAAE